MQVAPKVDSGDRAEKTATRASRSQDKELQKIDRRISEYTMPDDRGDPAMDALLNWEPVEYIPHVVCNMAKPRHSTNHASNRPRNTVQRLQSNLRESTIERRAFRAI